MWLFELRTNAKIDSTRKKLERIETKNMFGLIAQYHDAREQMTKQKQVEISWDRGLDNTFDQFEHDLDGGKGEDIFNAAAYKAHAI